MILDIREDQEEDITGIKFDETDSYIDVDPDDYFAVIVYEVNKRFRICDWKDFDNFIAALHKAKDLAGK